MVPGPDIRKLTVWCHFVDLDQFVKQVYDVEVWDYYHKGKWEVFQKDPMKFLGSLDQEHLARVAAAVNEFGG